jgi:hypothetical protein
MDIRPIHTEADSQTGRQQGGGAARRPASGSDISRQEGLHHSGHHDLGVDLDLEGALDGRKHSRDVAHDESVPCSLSFLG